MPIFFYRMFRNATLGSFQQVWQKEAQTGPVCNEEKRKEKKEQEGEGGLVQLHYRLVKPGTCDKEV